MLKIKSVTDVITNSSTEVFIISTEKSEEEVKLIIENSGNSFLRWVSCIKKFNLKDYKNWKKEKVEYNYYYECINESRFISKDNKSDYQYCSLLFEYLMNPKEIKKTTVETYSYYEDLKEPTPLISSFRKRLVQGYKDLELSKELNPLEEVVLSILKHYNSFDDLEKRLREPYSEYYSFSRVFPWLESFIDDTKNEFPPIEILSEIYLGLPLLEDIEGYLINFFEDSYLPNDYEEGILYLENLGMSVFCSRI